MSYQGCSLALEQVLSDFGFEFSFARAIGRVREHYGFDISESTLSAVTLKHAQGIADIQQARSPVGALPREGAEAIIAQSDGSFVRIVKTKPKAKDSRKTRTVDFQEARLCASTQKGSEQVCYEATFKEVDCVGLLWGQSAKNAGWALNSKIHAVSDGAPWICNQAERIFGEQGSFLIDFYHVCEYLAEAKTTCSNHPKRWMTTQKKRLKTGHAQRVIDELYQHLEPEHVEDKEAPVRRAYRYLTNRNEHLEYQQAIANKLPIGSGLIESGHKHVIQARMKIPGASWNIQNAENMLQARAFRANGKWGTYWNKLREAA